METKTAYFHFKGSLNDFLPEENRYSNNEYSFFLNPSVKDLVEALGVPHVEVFGISANDSSVSFDYNVKNDDYITVFPKEYFHQADKGRSLKPHTGLPDRLIADVHLGKLARLLRLMGIDTLYDNGFDDIQIVEAANKESRGVLSRDIDLLKHGSLDYGYWPRSPDPDKQVLEVLQFFDLHDSIDSFTRCLDCNGTLERRTLEEIEKKVPPNVKEWSKEFVQCTTCNNIYWKGSHYEQLKSKAESILEKLDTP